MSMSESTKTFIRKLNKARELLRPPPKLTISEWADEYRVLPTTNAEPGKWRTDRAPYQREMMDEISNPKTYRVTAMLGAQVGKTASIIENPIGFFISQDPKSMIVMMPTVGDLRAWVEGKLNPLLMETPSLADKMSKKGKGDGVNNMAMKSYPGGFLYLVSASQTSALRGKSAPIILVDECDGIKNDEGTLKEGDPIQIVWQRAATFGDSKKLIMCSTPTIKHESRIEDAYDQSDMRQFHLKFSCCGEYQVLKWSNILWDKDDNGKHLSDTAHYVCEHCGSVVTDGMKIAALRSGKWVARREFMGHAGFHLPEFYSPFRRFRDVVQSFLDKKAVGDLQSFVNVSLAETWEEDGETVDHGTLYERRVTYCDNNSFSVPYGGLVVVAGVDTQNDRLEAEAVAYGHDDQSWGIERVVFWGDPAEPDVWEQLDDWRRKVYRHEGGFSIPIAAVCIDSGGHKTQHVYDYCKGKLKERVFCIKGVGGEGRQIVAKPSEQRSGKEKRKVKLFPVGVDSAKALIYTRLRRKEGEPGYCNFPTTYDQEYFEQLTAEKLVTRFIKGFPKKEWIKQRPRNESLDIRVYALAALKLLNPAYDAIAVRHAELENRMNDDPVFKEKQEERINPKPEPEPEPEQTPTEEEPKRPRKRRRRGGVVGGIRR